jgi:hypothetical protein
MQYQELNRLKNKYPPEWKGYFDALDTYLAQISQRPAGNKVIVPALLVKKLGGVEGGIKVDENFATVLLRLADEAGIIQPLYIVYSPNNWILGEYHSFDEIPHTIYSEADNKEFSIEEFYIELVFELRNKKSHPSKLFSFA